MPDTFAFCPNSQVVENLPREGGNASVMTMNGWDFSSKPTTPYKRKFKVTLHGMKWFVSNAGVYDEGAIPDHNARLLEKFYEANETWKPFNWLHPHFNTVQLVRFSEALTVPAAQANSSGLLQPLEVRLIQHNPSY